MAEAIPLGVLGVARGLVIEMQLIFHQPRRVIQVEDTKMVIWYSDFWNMKLLKLNLAIKLSNFRPANSLDSDSAN